MWWPFYSFSCILHMNFLRYVFILIIVRVSSSLVWLTSEGKLAISFVFMIDWCRFSFLLIIYVKGFLIMWPLNSSINCDWRMISSSRTILSSVNSGPGFFFFFFFFRSSFIDSRNWFHWWLLINFCRNKIIRWFWRNHLWLDKFSCCSHINFPMGKKKSWCTYVKRLFIPESKPKSEEVKIPLTDSTLIFNFIFLLIFIITLYLHWNISADLEYLEIQELEMVHWKVQV